MASGLLLADARSITTGDALRNVATDHGRRWALSSIPKPESAQSLPEVLILTACRGFEEFNACIQPRACSSGEHALLGVQGDAVRHALAVAPKPAVTHAAPGLPRRGDAIPAEYVAVVARGARLAVGHVDNLAPCPRGTCQDGDLRFAPSLDARELPSRAALVPATAI